jgi:hypothetical protein
MKILRTVDRRGSSVGSAGWFTVLRSKKWSAAPLLPGSFHVSGRRSLGPAEPTAPELMAPKYADSRPATAPLQIMKLDVDDRGFMRPALIVLAAIAVSSVLLWWDMNCPRLW